jgi:hypothetical protein
MSLAILARKHKEKKKASQGKCFNLAMTNKGTVRRSIRKAKNGCSKIPAIDNSCRCEKDPKTGCSYKGCVTRPFFQRSYSNYLRQITTSCGGSDNKKCNIIKCNPDKPASDVMQQKKDEVLKDLSYNYVSQCISCKKKCSSNTAKKTQHNAFPKPNCIINTQKCNAPGQLTRLYVKKNWCNTVKDLGMRGSEDRLATLKAKVTTCRNSDGSSITDLCDCLSTKKNCA